MNLFTMKQISKSYTDKMLLEEADFSLAEGEKVGIIGINGTGKSTLLRLIAGMEEPDRGTAIKGNQVFCRYLSQNPEFQDGLSVYETVILNNQTQANQWTLEGEAKTILNRLGFADYEQRVETLSGGQKKKVALASVLLASCDILILDEPTNHLDYEMTEWLEQYLREYRGVIVMVTHDRYFLDLVCNRIVEIEGGKLYRYESNYEGYLELKMQREEMAYATQRKQQTILRKEIAWMQRGAKARATKQKAHIARYEALQAVELLQEEQALEMNALSERMGKKTLEAVQLRKAFGEHNVVEDFSYVFLRDDRIGLVGKNGCGKTTLLNMLTGVLEPSSGSVVLGETIKIGYFSQENEGLDGNQTVIGLIKETGEYIKTPEGTITASQMAERFLFDKTHQYTKIEKLSGGEKRRLFLLKVLMAAPNVLVLDEPTNDLDIRTLCVLEDYLDTFPGILITVSHDRYFLDRVVRKLFAFEGKDIKPFQGSYTEYYLQQKEKEEMQKQTQSGKKDLQAGDLQKQTKSREQKLKFSYKEQREYEIIETEILQVEGKIQSLEEEILKSARDFVRLNACMEEKQALETCLEEKMERFLYLQDLAEQIEAQKQITEEPV